MGSVSFSVWNQPADLPPAWRCLLLFRKIAPFAGFARRIPDGSGDPVPQFTARQLVRPEGKFIFEKFFRLTKRKSVLTLSAISFPLLCRIEEFSGDQAGGEAPVSIITCVTAG